MCPTLMYLFCEIVYAYVPAKYFQDTNLSYGGSVTERKPKCQKLKARDAEELQPSWQILEAYYT